MAILSLKSKLFKSLFKGARLSIFLENQTPNSKLSLNERILRSSFCKNLYSKEFADLNYHMSIQPYSSGSYCFGEVSMIEPIENGSVAVRGWLFSPNFRIVELCLIANEQRYPVYAFNLNRLDVYQNFYFLNNSKNCGFVCLLEDQKHEATATRFKFEARDYNGDIHVSGF